MPAAWCVVALVVGVVLPALDIGLSDDLSFIFQGGPAGARDLLGTIATAMISVTGLVFSITMVTLQLASSQFTPRVLGTFLSSRTVQNTLGVFVATFVFALTVSRSVRGGDGAEAFVPQLSVSVAFGLVLASVGFFLAFIHHITTSIQVTQVISSVGERTAALLDRMYPDAVDGDDLAAGPGWSPDPGMPRRAVASARHGVVTWVDQKALVRWAAEHDVVVTVDRAVGEFVTEGQTVVRVWGVCDLPDEELEALYDHLGLGSDRLMTQDVAFGFRQLVDIAERALSPGINDPTTAEQCIDEIHRLLRRLVGRASPSPFIADRDGAVRLVHSPQAVAELVAMPVRELAHYGAQSVRIIPRLREMLQDLLVASAPRYRTAVTGHLDELDAAERNSNG